MKKLFFILTVLLSFGLNIIAQNTTNCNCTLKGVVHETNAHNPIPGAVVYLKGTKYAVFTDAKGEYQFPKLCQGAYTLVCQAVGFQKIEVPINLTQEHSKELTLANDDEHLQEVVVSGKKTENQTKAKSVIEGSDLAETRGQSLGEALKAATGVTTLQTGSSIAKPVIHGMHSNRVLILNNGIRQEGQQWGSEHAPEIDPFMAQKLTVIKGAAGVRYGSDAIAGVIMVEPNPLPDSAAIHGEANLVGFSNGQQGIASGIIEGGLPKKKGWAWRLQGTYKRGADIKTADYYLANTGIQERNFSATVGYNTAHWGTEAYFSYFDTQLGIFSGSHIGNITDLLSAINSSRPNSDYTPTSASYTINRPNQDLAHNLFKVKSFLVSENLGKWQLTLSRQYDWRLEYDVPRGNRTLNTLNFKLTTYQAELLLDHKPLWNTLSGTVGASGMYQENLSSSYELTKPLINTVLIPNYQTKSGGIFLIERWVKNRWELEGGLRYDIRSSDAYGLDASSKLFNYSFTFNNASSTIGFAWNSSESLSIKGNAAIAWRAPNMNELFSNGVHHGAAAYEKGNINLQPEVAHNFSVSAEYSGSKWAWEISPYLNLINDFIYLKPRVENGEIQTVLSVRGAFPAFDYTQVDARFAGIDASVKYLISKHFTITEKYSMVRAKDTRNDVYMVNIPADRLESSLRYTFGKNQAYVSLTNLLVARQTRVEANSDFLAPPSGYSLWSMNASYPYKNFTFGLGVSNLLNKSYRDYMNRFRYFTDEMGRNISLRVQYRF